MGYLDEWKRSKPLTQAEQGLYAQEVYEQRKLDEILKNLKAMKVALGIPRRLGGGATGPELARDKKLLRKLLYLHERILVRWAAMANYDVTTVDLDQIPSEVRKLGAQMDLDKWKAGAVEAAQLDRSMIATSGAGKWQNKACGALTEELRELERIFSVT